MKKEQVQSTIWPFFCQLIDLCIFFVVLGLIFKPLHTFGNDFEMGVYRYFEILIIAFHGTRHNAKNLPSSAKTLTTHKPSARTRQT